MSATTPTPWRAERAEKGWYSDKVFISASHYSRPGVTDGRDAIATVHSAGGRAEQDANARLFVAAPQLRDACKVIALTPAIRAWLLEHDPKALQQVDSALAEAEPLPEAS